ncbi:MAG: UV DNA damage repair endonuclease UvsE [Deltaproteobacteria bacterium HGW-Deltaproteobacteria-4]|nr:MAG: UV DNA damage repair endonuclease UvsE [Deltaproteobacteria bacterium HGW-Deltaproteobacteria-4]
MRFGLCCLFKNKAITFRTTTAKALAPLKRAAQLAKLSTICLHNVETLHQAVETAHRLGIGAFRIMSPLFPRMTHPDVGYGLDDLPEGDTIMQRMASTRALAMRHDLRLSFHPDQFVVLSSPHPEVVKNSLRELEYQGELAVSLGADVINLHAGGVYGDKDLALQRFAAVLGDLSPAVRSRLSVENDDTSYTVRDLLPLCSRTSLPLVYDVHHHRCNPDGLTISEATELAAATWHVIGREPYCHLSSPRTGWQEGNPRPHADYIDLADLPECWQGRAMTVDIEAKAKELAVAKLMAELQGRGW